MKIKVLSHQVRIGTMFEAIDTEYQYMIIDELGDDWWYFNRIDVGSPSSGSFEIPKENVLKGLNSGVIKIIRKPKSPPLLLLKEN